MARPVEWYQRLPLILDCLERYQGSTIDRRAIESLFGVSRRQAVRLLDRLGAWECGGALVLDRENLIGQLREIAGQAPAQIDLARRRRVQQEIETLRENWLARQKRIPVPRPAPLAADGRIRISARKLEIDHTGSEDLLGQLYTLVRQLAQDPDYLDRLLS